MRNDITVGVVEQTYHSFRKLDRVVGSETVRTNTPTVNECSLELGVRQPKFSALFDSPEGRSVLTTLDNLRPYRMV